MAERGRRVRQAEIVRAFAARLREVRLSRGLTQAELGRRAGATASYVGRLEAAAVAPGIDLLGRLAAALGTAAADLLPEAEPPDEAAALRGEDRRLAAELVEAADRDALRMLNPLLARLLESVARRPS